ncbi:MAG: hypothetical protein LDLANPLL_00135 [Turneriella sp.]|nr:hypothetical protein [Turneriella sp.]
MGKRPCSLLVGSDEHPTGFISYTNLSTGLELKIRTQFNDSPKERKIILRHNNKRITVICRFILRNGPTEILGPQALEITDDVKKIETQSLVSTPFSLSNLTSTREIAHIIETNRKKVTSYVLNFFDEELKGLAPFHRVYLAMGIATDVRLRHLIRNPRIIYFSPDPPSGFRPQQFFPQNIYLAEIQRSDLKVPLDLKGEVTIPILYRQKLPIGYVQVNTPRFVDDAVFQAVKKIAVAIEAQLRKVGLAFEEAQTLPIARLDTKNLELEISDRILLRHFQPNLNLLFRLQKGNNVLGHFTAVVTDSSNLGGGKTRATLEFQEMDAMAELNLEEALEK